MLPLPWKINDRRAPKFFRSCTNSSFVQGSSLAENKILIKSPEKCTYFYYAKSSALYRVISEREQLPSRVTLTKFCLLLTSLNLSSAINSNKLIIALRISCEC